MIAGGTTLAFRAFSGIADGMDGVFVDVYGTVDCCGGATLIVYEGRPPRSFEPLREAAVALEVLRPLGVTAVYFKPFAKDRSKMGGELPLVATDPTPAAGDALAESILIREHAWTLEIRLYDGLSTGLFLDQRDNRKFVHDFAKRFQGDQPPSVLNTFAYTCAFSVAAAVGGAMTTSVDVSPRYLDWGKRNLAYNGIDASADAGRHRFAKMDTFEFFAYARRKQLGYDLILLDPPSFGSGNKKKNIRPWSAQSDYSRLVQEAAELLNPRGVIFASTNTQALCRGNELDRQIVKAIGREPRWIELPPPPIDFERDADRFAARAFGLT